MPFAKRYKNNVFFNWKRVSVSGYKNVIICYINLSHRGFSLKHEKRLHGYENMKEFCVIWYIPFVIRLYLTLTRTCQKIKVSWRATKGPHPFFSIIKVLKVYKSNSRHIPFVSEISTSTLGHVDLISDLSPFQEMTELPKELLLTSKMVKSDMII